MRNQRPKVTERKNLLYNITGPGRLGEDFPKVNEYLFVQWLMGFQTVAKEVELAQSRKVSLLFVCLQI